MKNSKLYKQMTINKHDKLHDTLNRKWDFIQKKTTLCRKELEIFNNLNFQYKNNFKTKKAS